MPDSEWQGWDLDSDGPVLQPLCHPLGCPASCPHTQLWAVLPPPSLPAVLD